jgi:hypothetical protein
MTAIPSAMQAGRRAVEIEDTLNNRIYHPLAFRLASLLRPTGITPNAVSVVGALTIVAAAWAYTSLAWPVSALIGFAFHLSWHVFDGADGDLARLTGRSSAHGELVDGVCDYGGHVVLYIAFAAFLDDWIGGWAWALCTVSGGSRIAQANHYESMRRRYLWWAYGQPWMRVADPVNHDMFRKPGWFNFVFGWMATDYLSLESAMAPRANAVDRLFADYADDPAVIARFRQVVRSHGKTLIPQGALLNANFRTVLLGGSMMLGSPLWYLLGEGIALNLVLIVSSRRKRRIDERLAEELRSVARGASD